MKKRMNRILSALLVFVLVLSTAQVVQASDAAETKTEDMQVTEEEVQAEEVQTEEVQTEEVQTEEVQAEEVQTEEVQAEEPEMAEETQNEVLSEAVEEIDMAEIDTKATVNGSIPVKISVTGNEALDAGAITYGSGNVLGNYCGYSQAVSFSGKGTVIIAVNNIEQSSSYIDYGIFRDKNLTDAVDYYGSSARGTVTQRAFKIPSAGTYYIGLRSSKGYGTSYYYYAGVAAAYYSGAVKKE